MSDDGAGIPAPWRHVPLPVREGSPLDGPRGWLRIWLPPVPPPADDHER